MNSNIHEGFIRLFEDAQLQTENFKRNLYEDSFEGHYKEYKGLLTEINGLIDEASDKESLICGFASVIPDYVKEVLAGIEKRAKETVLYWTIILHLLRTYFRLSTMHGKTILRLFQMKL